MRTLGPTLAALVATSSVGLAHGMPFTPALSCRTIANTVASSGAILLSTGPDRFDRYVSGQGQCALGEQTWPAWVISADNPSCFIGYTCEQYHE